jgi:hypothetical protein
MSICQLAGYFLLPFLHLPVHSLCMPIRWQVNTWKATLVWRCAQLRRWCLWYRIQQHPLAHICVYCQPWQPNHHLNHLSGKLFFTQFTPESFAWEAGFYL